MLDFVYLRLALQPSADTLAQINSCGQIVLEQYPHLIDGAFPLLDWASRHFELCLLTRGVVQLQMSKVEHVGISKYFRHIEVVNEKNCYTVSRLIETMGMTPSTTWVIGDSVKSDVNPGVEAGAKCILYVYTHHSYRWEQEYGTAAKGPFYKADKLMDIRKILESPEHYKMVTEIE